MPNFVLEQNALGLLVQDTIGGQPNPFKVAIEFLDKTEGRWDRDNTKEARKTPDELAGSLTPMPPTGKRWYRSKYFDENFLTFEQIAQAYGLFQATGLYGQLINYYAHVFIPDANYEDVTPVYMPMSEVDGQQVTWSQYLKDQNREHRKVEGGYTISLVIRNMYPVTGSVLAALYTNGYTLYTNATLPPVWVEPQEDGQPE